MTQLRYRFLQALRLRENIFWGFFFPLALGTLFYIAFSGLGDVEQFEPVKTAVVAEEENEYFEDMVDELDGDILLVSYMDQEQAQTALEKGEVSGIYYSSMEPSLEVSGNGFESTVLSSVLKQYEEYIQIDEKMAAEHPERIEAFFSYVSHDTRQYLRSVSLGGSSYDSRLEYYYALIAMACFFGCFTGQTLGEQNAANVSALAARRAVSPRSKLSSIFTDMLVGFTIQFASVTTVLCYLQYAFGVDVLNHFGATLIITALGSLLGVSYGIFIGSLAVPVPIKSILTIAVPLFLCFLSGLMYGGMKQLIEDNVPIINRINPAALISDGFYYLNVYEDMAGFTFRMLLLAAYSFGMAFLAVFHLRRQRYGSI